MQNILSIRDALPDDFANRVRAFLDKSMPHEWWFRGVASKEKIPDTEENREENIRRIATEINHAAAGVFSYSFRRTVDNHVETCDCQVCQALDVFGSELFLRRVSDETGIAVSTLGHCFASCYAPGDFLSTHTDKDNGKLAFVWNLTKHWMPHWGGNLCFVDSTWSRVESTIVPAFNELIVFDVRGEGRPHFVSEVITGIREKRLAISGWFS